MRREGGLGGDVDRQYFFALFRNINNFTSDFLMTPGIFSLVKLVQHIGF